MEQTRKVPFLDLKSQIDDLRGEIVEAIEETIESSSFILGPKLEKFEAAFASYCGCRYAIGVSSGTAALHLALLALGVSQGDEVITVPNTFVATIEAIVYTGATPVLVDVDEDTFCMDPGALERALTEKTRAIIPVHLYGQPCQMEPILDLAEAHRIYVIEDACQAHGARYKGRRVGSMGHAAAFSFYPSKNLGAFGDGGAVTTNDGDIAARIESLRHHAQIAKNVHTEVGYNYRLDDLQAAVLLVKIRHLDKWNEARRNLALCYREKLRGTDYKFQECTPGGEPVYHIFAIRHGNARAVEKALDEANVAWGKHISLPVHLQPGYDFLGYERGSFPVTEKLSEEMISLPIFPGLSRDQVEYVAETLCQVVVSM